jgi:predicted glycosyltransferase
MYSHDTYGLGHLRRTIAIASRLRQSDANVLILTGSPVVGQFNLKSRIDFVRIPGMIKISDENYLPLSMKLDARQVLKIRQTLITATAKAFKPDLFIVDKAPLGLKREIIPTLKWFQKFSPQTKTVLGLRDIMDDSTSTIKDWEEKGVYEVLGSYYSEIWVYGQKNFYDPILEYDIPEHIAQKMVFTGYIPRTVARAGQVKAIRRDLRLEPEQKLVLVTPGGGGDGYPHLDVFLTMLEEWSGCPPFRTVLVTGPFMPKKQRSEIIARSRNLGVRCYRFYRRMERMIGAADVVVSMGGYNTVCEILSQGKPSLIIPRENPRREQLIRAQVLYDHHLADYLPWQKLHPDLLREKLQAVFEKQMSFAHAVQDFKFTGFEVIRQRLDKFRKEDLEKRFVYRVVARR